MVLLFRGPGVALPSLAFALTALLLMGCGVDPPSPAGPPPKSVGVYDFTTIIPFRTGSISLSGVFEITPDTVLLLMDNASCQEVQGSLSIFMYRCGGAPIRDVLSVYVTFDRANPHLYCGASAERRTPVEREVCSRYMVTKEGQRVCILWRIETTYETERRSAPLLTTRRSTAWR